MTAPTATGLLRKQAEWEEHYRKWSQGIDVKLTDLPVERLQEWDEIERKQREWVEKFEEKAESLKGQNVQVVDNDRFLASSGLAGMIMEQIADFVEEGDRLEVYTRTQKLLYDEGVILDPQQEVQL